MTGIMLHHPIASGIPGIPSIPNSKPLLKLLGLIGFIGFTTLCQTGSNSLTDNHPQHVSILATEHCRTSGYTFQTSFRFDGQGFPQIRLQFNKWEDRSLKRRDLGMFMAMEY